MEPDPPDPQPAGSQPMERPIPSTPTPASPVMEPAKLRIYDFRWRMPDGQTTSLSCYARSEAEAEDSARRAGWPGHDGTRLGRFRVWLKEELLEDRRAAAE